MQSPEIAATLPRMARFRLTEVLADTPVVLLHGPRQCGKTTLARAVTEPLGYGYLSFDDDNAARAARLDPQGFVADLPPRMVLDEIQRVPELFTSIKAVVDQNRMPGRFLLTGSANVLLLPKLADSLAGRMEVLRLHPMAQAELAGSAGTAATVQTGQKPPAFLNALFTAKFETGGFERARYTRQGPQLAARIAAGGFPAALARTPRRAKAWYSAYVESLAQRDVRELARISSLDVLPRLLQVAADQTAQLFNLSSLAGPFQLSRPTIGDYVGLLERVFLLDSLASWHPKPLNKLIKSPKLHMADTGLACALLRLDAETLNTDRQRLGQLLETFVLQELRRAASAWDEAIDFFHFRSRDDYEVDVVLERGPNAVAGVEVKASGTVREADFRGLKKLQEIAGPNFVCGVVLYDGDTCLRFGEGMFAVPISALWEMTC